MISFYSDLFSISVLCAPPFTLPQLPIHQRSDRPSATPIVNHLFLSWSLYRKSPCSTRQTDTVYCSTSRIAASTSATPPSPDTTQNAAAAQSQPIPSWACFVLFISCASPPHSNGR
ncbi:hypothetical protein BDR03DRAFT_965301 [Suillus americanus]|nr:hypothetical protein BDR03DRAFT_965301 [Suillus americanus]